MSQEEILVKVKEFLKDEFEIDESKITPNAHLINDLELESLDFVDIVVIIEKEFGFKVKREDMMHVRTINDMCTYIENQISNK